MSADLGFWCYMHPQEAAGKFERMRSALKEFVDRCPDCGGTGTAYTHEDETQVGCAPGSSGIDCPGCTAQRAALNEAQVEHATPLRGGKRTLDR